MSMQTTTSSTDMTISDSNPCPCADTASVRKCRRRRIGAFAAILALATTVVWGETWAIEHAPALPTGLVHVLGDSCGVSAVPFAIIH
jgi:hypothetical protein